MQTYIALLRGINVSGQKMIKMNDLKTLFESIGFQDVTTYIQSGNVVFQHPDSDINNLQNQISQNIFHKYQFDVQVIIRTQAELKEIIGRNPFSKETGIDTDRLYITFLSSEPLKTNSDNIISSDFEPDRFIIFGKEVYIYCPVGYGRSKLNNNFFEKKLKVVATTRNLKTVIELVNIC